MFKEEKDKGFSKVETIIGPSVKVEGDFAAAGDVVVEGAVSGQLRTEQSLRIGEQAKILNRLQKWEHLSERLGHSLKEVIGGIIFGGAITLIGIYLVR